MADRRATITRTADADFAHARIIGPKGEFARVILRLEPLQRGAGVEFRNASNGDVLEEYIPAVERGIRKAALEAMDGFSIVDFRASLIGGAYHDIDSSPHAFALAAEGAFRKALEKAAPVVLFN